jgi:translation elongation factor EF-1beta
MTNEYDNIRETISEKLDWREQVRTHPVAFSIGALALGLIVGRGLAKGAEVGIDTAEDYFEGSADVPSMQHGGRVTHLVNSVRSTSAFHQVTDGLSTVVNELVGELVKVGREQVIPNVVSRVSSSLGVDYTPGRSTRY